MKRYSRSRKLFSVVMSMTLALCMLLPSSVFARQEHDGARVGYKHVVKIVGSDTEKTITNLDDESQEWVFCVSPNRDARSNTANGEYRFRYNLNNNAYMIDNINAQNKRDGKSGDYMIGSGDLAVLAKILYVSMESGSTTPKNGYKYQEIQNAVYWAVINGKGDPNNGSIGQSYRGGKADEIIKAAANATLPNNWTLWMYLPDSDAGAGNLQATVNLTYSNDTPTPPAGKTQVKVKFNLEKKLVGEGAPSLKEGQFSFKFTGDDGYEQTVTNKADGTIESPVLTFTSDMLGDQRTFHFSVSEVEGNDPTIKNYDEKIVDVDVNVQKDLSNNRLTLNIWGEEFANSDDNSETPAVFPHTVNTFTNEYEKPEDIPEIVNTTAMLDGVASTDTEPATYTAAATESISKELKDTVTFKNLDAGKTYTIVSTVTNEKGATVDTQSETITGLESGSVTLTFANLTREGTYSIKTELKDGNNVIFTHNGDLNDNKETVIIEKLDEEESPKVKNTTAIISGIESTASKPAEYKANANEDIGLVLKDKIVLEKLKMKFQTWS